MLIGGVNPQIRVKGVSPVEHVRALRSVAYRGFMPKRLALRGENFRLFSFLSEEWRRSKTFVQNLSVGFEKQQCFPIVVDGQTFSLVRLKETMMGAWSRRHLIYRILSVKTFMSFHK